MKVKLNLDWKHIALFVLSTFAGAVVVNLQQDTGLVASMQHWSTLKPELVAALSAGLISVISQARKSFLELVLPTSGSASGGGSASSETPTVPPPSALRPPPAPPVQTRSRFAFATLAFAVLTFCCALSCAALKKDVEPLLPVVPVDLVKDYQCVQGDIDKGVRAIAVIEKDCLPGQLATITSIVETLLASGAFTSSHQGAVPDLSREVALVRVSLAAPTCDAGAK